MAVARAIQPNLVRGTDQALQRRSTLAILLILTGMGAGLCGATFMGLLHFVQHLAWDYQFGDFLEGVQQTTYLHRFLIVGGAGLLVAAGGSGLRAAGGHGGEVSEAIWRKSARMSLLPTFAKATFSIILVALGAAVGREGAPKQGGPPSEVFWPKNFALRWKNDGYWWHPAQAQAWPRFIMSR